MNTSINNKKSKIDIIEQLYPFLKIRKNISTKHIDILSILYSKNKNTECNLFDFIKNNSDNLQYWKILLFQVLSTLADIQQLHPQFRHNNLNIKNIYVNADVDINSGVDKKDIIYQINEKKYEVPFIGYKIVINHFDYVSMPGFIQNKMLKSKLYSKINLKQNRYYDVHYFICNLIMTCSSNKILIPPEIKEFIDRIIPSQYQKLGNVNVDMKGRLKVNDEYITPQKIIECDQFFDEFRLFSMNEMPFFDLNFDPMEKYIEI